MWKSKTLPNGKEFHEAGIWETIKSTLLGVRRPFDCLQIEVTSRCLGRCTYCPHTILRDKWLSRDMSMDTYARLWPLMRRASRIHLQGWGEPLLNPMIFEMAALARKAGCNVSTTTCGIHMNTTLARKIVESGMDIVAFSLAGTDAVSNASRRGVDFERVCEAVSILQTVRKERVGVHLEIHFAYLMLASYLNAVYGLPELMKRLGVHAAVISTLDYILDPGLTSEAFTRDDVEKQSQALFVLEEAAGRAHKMGLEFHYRLPSTRAPGDNCRENIFRCLFVSADGSVSPCVYVNIPADYSTANRRVFGNVHTQDPLAIWQSETFQRFRDRLAAGQPDLPCQACPKRFMAYE